MSSSTKIWLSNAHEQHDDGATFSSPYLIDHVVIYILKVSSKASISLSVESIQMLMKGELMIFNMNFTSRY